MSETPGRIAIACNVAPTYPGGLAAYQKALATSLSTNTHLSGGFYCVDSIHPKLPSDVKSTPWPIERLQPSLVRALTQSMWPSFASRPENGVLEFLSERGWSFPQTPPPSIVHFVGTGWDFVGFFFSKWARQLDARFTMWPAVHPHQWGDDKIDVRLYNRADVVMCQSEFERSHLQALGVDASKLELCGLFPMCREDGDSLRFRQAHELGVKPCVLFLGRRDFGKGYPALMKAWPLVLKEVPEAILLLAGPSLEKSELPSSASIRDLGIITEEQKADALAACDVFCLPSAHEAFGIVFTEAWLYEKPVICGTAAASRELVADGETGLWANHDPETLAQCLVRLLKNPAEAQTLGQAGHKLQQERYNQNIFLKNHLRAFGPAAKECLP